MDNIPKNQIKSRNTIEQREHEDKAAARRVLLVDDEGVPYDESYPLPTSAVLDVESLEVTVNLDAFTKDPPDNAIAVGTEDGTKTGIKHAHRVDDELDLRVGISDGANKAEVSDGNLHVKDEGLPESLGQKAAAESTSVVLALDQPPVPVEVQGSVQIDEPVTVEGSVSISGPVTLAEPVTVDGTVSISGPVQIDEPVTVEGSVSITGPVQIEEPVTVEGSVSVIGPVQVDEPVRISGTIDGTPGGTEFPFVNNRKNQILEAHDRIEAITRVDLGTCNERITQIDYTSLTIGTGPGFTARKSVSYVLSGTKYVISGTQWSLV